MTSDGQQLRQRQSEIRGDIARSRTDDAPSIFACVVELIKVEGRWPDAGPGTQVYAAQAVYLTGLDRLGEDVVVTRSGPDFRVFNAGNGTPPDPDLGVPTRTIATGSVIEYYDH